MSGQSSVGNSGVYEAGDQRNPPDSQKDENQSTPYEEGKENSHKDNDPSTCFNLLQLHPRLLRLRLLLLQRAFLGVRLNEALPPKSPLWTCVETNTSLLGR